VGHILASGHTVLDLIGVHWRLFAVVLNRYGLAPIERYCFNAAAADKNVRAPRTLDRTHTIAYAG
jgi:hypothetical protein